MSEFRNCLIIAINPPPGPVIYFAADGTHTFCHNAIIVASQDEPIRKRLRRLWMVAGWLLWRRRA